MKAQGRKEGRKDEEKEGGRGGRGSEIMKRLLRGRLKLYE